MKYIGIDLGTTYSCICKMDDISTSPDVVNSLGGKSSTPSVVWFKEDGSVVVGDLAKRKLRTNPDSSVELAKRYMGTDKTWNIFGDDYTPVDISSFILKELIGYFQLDPSEDYRCTITCPACYDSAQRELVKQAAEKAGIKRPSIINEPTAAAISFCKAENVGSGGVLVFDLGGGTLDVTALYYDSAKDKFEVMASDGRNKLGGADWDKVVEEILLDCFAESGGESVSDLKNDSTFMAALSLKAEEIKKELTLGDYSEDVFIQSRSADVMITRETFDMKSRALFDDATDLLQSVLDTIPSILSQHNMTSFDVNRVVLVGGSCWMPQIKEGIAQKYPQFANKIWVHEPETAIAKGATYYAKIVPSGGESTGSGTNPGIVPGPDSENKFGTEVLSTTFGTDVGDGMGGVVCDNLLYKNDMIPCEVSRTYYLSQGQTGVSNKVYMNSCRDRTVKNVPERECSILGNFDLNLPFAAREGEPIEVKFVFGLDGTLTCESFCRDSHSIVRVDKNDLGKNLKSAD